MLRTKTKSKAPQTLSLWCQIGSGEAEEFGQDDSALADALYESRISPIGVDWFNCPRNPQSYAKKHKLNYLPDVGFRSESGTHVAVYWGDEDGSLVQPLTRAEQRSLIFRLEKLEKGN